MSCWVLFLMTVTCGRYTSTEITIAGVPLPESLTFWVPSLASSLTLKTPLRIPRAVGRKAIVITHCCPDASAPPHVSAGDEKSPVAAIEEIFNTFLVGLESVTDWELDIPKGLLPKSREEGEILTISAKSDGAINARIMNILLGTVHQQYHCYRSARISEIPYSGLFWLLAVCYWLSSGISLTGLGSGIDLMYDHTSASS